MKYIIIPFLMVLFGSCASTEKAKINKVEHLYISSNHASQLFNIFEKEFGLPVVWEFQDWGTFTSGGITLGNAVLEIVEHSSDKTRSKYGIALEPNEPLEKMLFALDSVNISYQSIGKSKDWDLLELTNLLPDSINLFLCDYHNKELVDKGREDAIDELGKQNGGNLGIQFLKEINIGTNEKNRFEQELEKVPGIIKKDQYFSFPEGPKINLIDSDTFSFELMIKVKSLEKVKEELETRGFKSSLTNQGLALQNNMNAVKIIFCY